MTDLDVKTVAEMQYKIDQYEAYAENLFISIREERAIPKLVTIDAYGFEEVWKLLSFIEKKHPQLFAEFKAYRAHKTKAE